MWDLGQNPRTEKGHECENCENQNKVCTWVDSITARYILSLDHCAMIM